MDFENLDKIKGDYNIYCNQRYIVLVGSMLWIYKIDGTLVACRKDIVNVNKIAFLSKDRLITCGGKGASYHLLSLVDGSEIWSIPRMKKVELFGKRFAIPSDDSVIYDYFYWKNIDYLVTIYIESGNIQICQLQKGLNVTTDFICDQEGVPCLLQCNYENISGQKVSQNGIRYFYADDYTPGRAYYWKYKWQHQGNTIAALFLDSTEMILTKDLFVYIPKSGEQYYLLENDNDRKAPEYGMLEGWFDSNKEYLSISYDNCNVVVDWKERKAVARYVSNFLQGCLINDEYWICTDGRIRRVAFPLIEDLPPRKLSTWGKSIK